MTTASSESLANLVDSDQWNAFDEAWTSLMLEEGPTEPVLLALTLAADKKKLPRCIQLAREHAELLVNGDRAPEAAALLGRAMLLGGSPGELGDPIWRAASAAWSEEDWWLAYTEIAGLAAGAPDMRRSWKRFSSLLQLEPGRAIFHAQGWGPGEVTELDRTELEVKVRFTSGRRDRFPLSTAVDIFQVLAKEDLRSMLVLAPDDLAVLLKKEHVKVLEAVLRRFDGKANYGVVKNAVVQLGLSPTAFAAWWRKARKLAEATGWFDITGSSAKAVIQVRYSEADPSDAIRRQVLQAKDLTQAVSRVRAILQGKELDARLQGVAIDTLVELAREPGAELSAQLGTWMLVREQKGETPEELADKLQEAVEAEPPPDPSQPPALWKLFQTVPGSREQERCLQLLQEVHEDDWLEQACTHLPHAAPGMVRVLIETLLEKEQNGVLAAQYASLLARPLRNPHVLVALADLAESGRIEGEFPGPLQRAQALMGLAVHLEATKVNNVPVQRTRLKLSALFKSGVLRALVETAEPKDLRALVNQAERGVDSVVDSVLTDIVVDMAPEVYRADDKPFWEMAGIWTTKRGMERRSEELRILRDIKIPENSEAIGRAAAFGDLSENSEWEAAIEEQRTLTSRAMSIEAELRTAQLLEDAPIPVDKAAPGNIVNYVETESGTRKRAVLVGPWDTDDHEHAVSYRSPLASGMLGLKAGQEVEIELPSGTLNVRVESIESLGL